MGKESEELKSCFVIAPLGAEGSDTRKRSDQVLEYIIRPVCQECGYGPVRADKISEPGIVTSQIIQHLVDDDLVIADLTDHNPNVFYELAIRHAFRRPIVVMIDSGQRIPFDVAAARTVQVDVHDLESVDAAKKEMARQIKAAEAKPDGADSPVATAVRLKALDSSENPLEKATGDIMALLQETLVRVDAIEGRHVVRAVDPVAHRVGRDLAEGLAAISQLCDGPPGPTVEVVERIGIPLINVLVEGCGLDGLQADAAAWGLCCALERAGLRRTPEGGWTLEPENGEGA